MQFGNWNISDEQISFAGSAFRRFVIPVNELLETVDVPEAGGAMYKWIILATEEDPLTTDDLYDLNYAFAFAAGKAGLKFDYNIFDRTLEYQYYVLDEEDDDDGGGTTGIDLGDKEMNN